jgi:hypothetical protein
MDVAREIVDEVVAVDVVLERLAVRLVVALLQFLNDIGHELTYWQPASTTGRSCSWSSAKESPRQVFMYFSDDGQQTTRT